MKIIEEAANKLSFYNAITDKLFLETYYEEESQILYLTWYGFTPIDEIINAYLTIGKYHKGKEYLILKALADLTYLEGSFERHNDWMIKEYWPKAMKYGYYRTAFVKSKDYLPNLALAFLKEENETLLKGHEIKIFDTVKEAEEWLKS